MVERLDRVLRLKETGSHAHARELESQLDRLIYTLYGLTAMETELVSDSSG